MKFKDTVNIHNLTHAQRSVLPIGQWVSTTNNVTTPEDRGVFLGVKANGTVVVAWYGNAKGHTYYEYIRKLRAYALN
jgi:hypothetical protein